LKKNVEIKNLENISLSSNDYIFHAGTLKKENKIFAVGGRVLNFVSLSENFNESKKNVYNIINNLDWKDGFFRKDIGYKVIS
jgi:phosphoribosylamine--glycine ligase